MKVRAESIRWRRRWVTTGLLCVLCGVATGAPKQGDAAPAVLRIGVSTGLSGDYQSIGRLQQRAYLLWQKHVNEHGGILGRRVQVVIRDDRSDAATARQIYEDFVGRERMDFVFGPYSSANVAAIAPLIDKHGYPTLTSATADTLWQRGYQNLFGVNAPASRYAIGFFALIAEAGIQRIAIVSATDDFSVEAAQGMQAWAPRYALRISSLTKCRKTRPPC